MYNTCFLIIVVIFLVYFIVKNTASFKVCYGKNDHLDQKIWGPSAWEFLHSIAFAYPENPTQEDKTAANNFIHSFACMLPCSVCKDHFKSNIKVLPVDVSTREKFFDWTVQLHNLVNKQLGKPQFTTTEIFDSYKKKYNR